MMYFIQALHIFIFNQTQKLLVEVESLKRQLEVQMKKYEEDMKSLKSAGSDKEVRLQEEINRLKIEMETLKRMYEEKLQSEKRAAEENLNRRFKGKDELC